MANPKREPQDLTCGMTGWRPTWLQPFATARSFLFVFGFLGSIQMMSFLYFTITLTTLEKRFKIPSSSTGKICVSDIAIILTYIILHNHQALYLVATRFRKFCYHWSYHTLVARGIGQNGLHGVASYLVAHVFS